MRVTILATGGTIASLEGPDGRWVPSATADELVDGIPGLGDLAQLTVEPMDQVSGWNITPERMVEVAVRARDLLESGNCDGVVVTHGTDTTEETLYMVELLAAAATRRGPIVFACAMRAGSEPSPDGPRNLLNAVRIAADPGSRCRGVLLSVNDQIHHSSWVTKLNTTNIETFVSVVGGPVGYIAADGPKYLIGSPKSPSGHGITGPVPLVKAFTGMDADIIDWHLGRGLAGLVIEGSGAGNLPGSVVPGVARALDAGVPVVVTSRCPFGLPISPYGGPGGGAALDAMGVLRAAHLNGPKARIALMVALNSADNLDDIRVWFSHVG
jgi:L-asparaginase